ncbi:SigE family RNA polymerase sigma factor [Nocardioides sp. AE5]|uniref:SigE family RNA polymerase sigma factor n=1 Tax=Nocardioides sp. AE5 TaxID=2962573 RepID=UPI00288270A2|nr:SigE family RNA polymerase sigma factor [Nocardioides sp. AE5]MDT0200957.1 SigE family RNA polymerase sigma factor [Nocardioides sp. AE5]
MDAEDEFSEYVAARWARLVRAAVLLGASPAEAEDITQTALTRCLVRWSKVRRAADRDAYVHRVLVNTFISARRRRWTGERPTSEVPEQASGDHAEQVETADLVSRSLARLSDEQRAVVVLRYYAHLGEAQTAAALGIPAGTVKSRLARALKVLSNDPDLSELRGR